MRLYSHAFLNNTTDLLVPLRLLAELPAPRTPSQDQQTGQETDAGDPRDGISWSATATGPHTGVGKPLGHHRLECSRRLSLSDHGGRGCWLRRGNRGQVSNRDCCCRGVRGGWHCCQWDWSSGLADLSGLSTRRRRGRTMPGTGCTMRHGGQGKGGSPAIDGRLLGALSVQLSRKRHCRLGGLNGRGGGRIGYATVGVGLWGDHLSGVRGNGCLSGRGCRRILWRLRGSSFYCACR